LWINTPYESNIYELDENWACAGNNQTGKMSVNKLLSPKIYKHLESQITVSLIQGLFELIIIFLSNNFNINTSAEA
jgi:hypothetical protein